MRANRGAARCDHKGNLSFQGQNERILEIDLLLLNISDGRVRVLVLDGIEGERVGVLD